MAGAEKLVVVLSRVADDLSFRCKMVSSLITYTARTRATTPTIEVGTASYTHTVGTVPPAPPPPTPGCELVERPARKRVGPPLPGPCRRPCGAPTANALSGAPAAAVKFCALSE